MHVLDELPATGAWGIVHALELKVIFVLSSSEVLHETDPVGVIGLEPISRERHIALLVCGHVDLELLDHHCGHLPSLSHVVLLEL
jgi:hypothetical protein